MSVILFTKYYMFTEKNDYYLSDIVNRIRNGESIPYRPVLPEATEMGRPLVDLIKSCWSENPDQRPNFVQIRAALRKLTNGE